MFCHYTLGGTVHSTNTHQMALFTVPLNTSWHCSLSLHTRWHCSLCYYTPHGTVYSANTHQVALFTIITHQVALFTLPLHTRWHCSLSLHTRWHCSLSECPPEHTARQNKYSTATAGHRFRKSTSHLPPGGTVYIIYEYSIHSAS